MLAGRLDARLDGRPVVIVADDKGVDLVGSWRSIGALRRTAGALPSWTYNRCLPRLRVRLRPLPAVTLATDGWLFGFLVPSRRSG